MIPNPQPSMPPILSDGLIAAFVTIAGVAGSIAVTAALILAGVLLHAYYAETYHDRGRALMSYTLLLGVAVLVALGASAALNQWSYFIIAILAPFVAFGGRWAVVRFLDRRAY